jgi:hypothetical protein
MIFDLSAGEVLHVGEVATLTVLAVEGDLICLGLETAEGVRSTAGDVSKDSNGASRTQGVHTWTLN